MSEKSDGWNDAAESPPSHGRAVLALLAVPNMGYSNNARAWVIARWNAEKHWWEIVDPPNDRGRQSPVQAMIRAATCRRLLKGPS
jgi:hypothetical protein